MAGKKKGIKKCLTIIAGRFRRKENIFSILGNAFLWRVIREKTGLMKSRGGGQVEDRNWYQGFFTFTLLSSPCEIVTAYKIVTGLFSITKIPRRNYRRFQDGT